MNREDIIAMALEAGISESHAQGMQGFLERFAALVVAKASAAAVECEREACAKVCDSISEDQWALYKGRPPYTGKELERASEYTQGKSDGAEVCAAAIRARGETK